MNVQLQSDTHPRCTEWFIAPVLIVCLTMPGCIGIVGLWGKEWTAIGGREEAERYEKPDRIEITEVGSGRELWIYHQEGAPLEMEGFVWHGHGFRWFGMVLFVIVPIPLVVPVGYDKMVLVVEQGRVLSTVYRGTVAGGGLCRFVGLNPHDDFGFRCHTGSIAEYTLSAHD